MRTIAKRFVAIVTCTSAVFMSLVAIWYWFSPSMTLEAMADAAARKDGVAVASYMDMDALRSDTRAAAEETLKAIAPSGEVVLNHRAITEILIGKVIDEVFSTNGTSRLLENQADPHSTRNALRYRILVTGPNKFIARIENPARVDLVFIRHGAEWLLSSIRERPPRQVEKFV